MTELWVNDVHSALNATQVAQVLEPSGTAELVGIVRDAKAQGAQISVCGSRHAMGGQQFGTQTWLVDLRRHSAILSFDRALGLITVESGIQWPELIAGYNQRQSPGGRSWGIRQKQTGGDRLTLGGALAANIHGRGLRMGPMINDVESFTLVDPAGEVRRCSRQEHAELFGLVIGGYGLFGIVAEITLRLMERVAVKRQVEILNLEELVEVPEARDTSEWLFGDFQYSIDENSKDFLRRGVFSAYQRMAQGELPAETCQQEIHAEGWLRLAELAHTDRARVFEEYSRYYLSTHGQSYWSDTHQLGTYVEGYHDDLCVHSSQKQSEMITEIYVPRQSLAEYMAQAALLLRSGNVPVIYGTIRLIEQDTESFLAWAREPWACIIFNLCVTHSPEGVNAAREVFCGLIDRAIALGGSYYLTYHRWASRAQVEACHPKMAEFLRYKRAYDPGELFTSDWYRHHRDLFA